MEHKSETISFRLAQCFPKDTTFKYYHVSTVPSICDALFSPPPSLKPEKTYCESHFFIVTIFLPDSRDEVAIYAIEVFIYTTSTLTTVFVSKADSTGYASYLNLPTGFPSPLKPITSAIISWIISDRHRTDRKLVVSLFARAQNQYLFPGSSENAKKHVLDDRGLVRWWCKALDPVLREYKSPEESKEQEIRSKAYIIVPGHDRYETRVFMPPSTQSDPADRKRWINGHPLYEISSIAAAPPRSLVPRFPDDPKARFLFDLDAEIPDVPLSQREGLNLESPSKRGAGQWKSVKSLDQFWEMMQFRQECSSGRLVGFLWLVFSPSNLPNSESLAHARDQSPSPTPSATPLLTDGWKQQKVTPRRKRPVFSLKKRIPASTRLKGIIQPRAPRIKSERPHGKGSQVSKSKYFHTLANQMGNLVLSNKAYSRMNETLRRLDFATVETASASTNKWIKETAVIGGETPENWGVLVFGARESPEINTTSLKADVSSGIVNVVLTKKRKAEDLVDSTERHKYKDLERLEASSVQTLSGSLIRKKTKEQASAPITSSEPQVNTLGSNLVRKKAKLT